MQSLSRALTVLEELSRQEAPQTLTQLTMAVGLHKSTVYRMLATFVRHGVVRRDEANRYQVASDVFGGAGHGAEVVNPALSELARRTGSIVSLTLPRNGTLERCTSFHANGARTEPATELSWHASGPAKAYLASRPRAEVQKYVGRLPLPAYTTQTITDPFSFMQVLARVRERGFAVEDREQDVTLRALAAAITDDQGNASAAVELQIPGDVHDPADLQCLGAQVRECAETISEQLMGCACSSRSPLMLEQSGA